MTARVFVLRPEPGLSATLARAAERGLEAFACPLFEVRGLAWQCPNPKSFAAILLTSANGARCAGPGRARYLHLPVCAVGEATAAAAREAGFGSVVAGDGDVARLIAKIATLGHQRLLHLSGAHVSEAAYDGIEVVRRIVYESVEVPAEESARAQLEAGGVALVHSPRAGKRLAELARNRSALSLAAISARAAAAAGDGWQRVEVAPHPRDGDLLDVAERLARG